MKLTPRLSLAVRRFGQSALVGFCCLVLMTGAAHAQHLWRRVGTISGTLTANQMCYTNGSDILCDTTAPTLSSGSVGIGTASPNSMLQVYGGEVQVGSSSHSCSSTTAGAVRFSGTTLYYCDGTTWQSIYSSGTGGGGIAAAGSTGQVQFNGGTYLDADNNFYWDNTNKRLGLGTATPSYQLESYRSDTTTSGGPTFVARNYLHLAPATNSSAAQTAAANYIDTSGSVNYTGDIAAGYNLAEHNGTGTVAVAYGAYNDAYNAVNGTITGAYGSWNRAINIGTGTITSAVGTVGEVVQQAAAGTITNAFSLYATGTVGTGGTITNYYGVYIAPPTVSGTLTNSYALYSASTGNSYFAGNVGIGTASPASKLQVYGGEVQVGSSSNTCSATTAGAIRYSGGSLYFCNSSAWTNVNSGSSLTWPLAGAADSVSAPDYAWSGHTNTGLYYNSGIGFAVGGANVATLTSTGLGIGTTAPGASLHVNGSTAIFGTGDATGSPGSATIRAPNAGSTNVAGSNLTLQAGDGTGTGGSGAINFQTAPASGGSVSTVAFDAGAVTAGSGGTSITYSFTVGSNPNRLLIVNIAASTTHTISSVTYAGVALTQYVADTWNYYSDQNHYVYYLLAPATGANNLVVNYTTAGSPVVGISSFYNVSPSSPLGTASTFHSNSTSDTLTVSSNANALVYDSLAGLNYCATPNAGQTPNFTCNAGYSVFLTSSRKAGAASVSMKETFSSQYYDHVVFSINGAGSDGQDTLATVMTITNTGNVGIGTATPGSMLQAYGGEVQVGSSANACSATTAGAIRYNGGTLYYCNASSWTALAASGSLTWPLAGAADSVSAPDYAWSGHTNTGLYYNTGIGFAVGGSNIATITSTGLGIGTATPATTLDVNGSEALRLGADLTTTGSQNNVAIGSSSALRYAGTAAATFTGIAAGGNGQLLYLHNASGYTVTLSNLNSSSTAANEIITGTNADLPVLTETSVTLQYDPTATNTSGNTGAWRVTGGSGGGTPGGSDTQVQFNNSGAFGADSNFVWDNTNKRLGIGTTAPNATLHVNGSTAIFGTGDATTSPGSATIRAPNASGGAIQGGSLILQAGNGTYTAGGGSFSFQTAAAMSGGGPISYDSGTTTNYNSTTSTGVSLTIGSNSDRLLIVDIAVNGPYVSSVKYGGTAMTYLTMHYATSTYHYIYYMTAPPTGANSVAVTFSSYVSGSLGASSFYNVSQTSPLGTPVDDAGNSGSSSSGTVSSNASDMVYDSLAAYTSCATSYGSGQTASYTCTGINWPKESSSYKAGAASVTMTETFASTYYDHITVSITGANDSTVTDTLSTVMTITNAGLVGIGTTSPNSMLQTYGGEVQVGSSANACSATTAGAIRYSGGTLYYCNASSWTSLSGGGGGTPAGSNTQVQFNSSGSFGADSNFVWDNTNKRLGIGSATPSYQLDNYKNDTSTSGWTYLGESYLGLSPATTSSATDIAQLNSVVTWTGVHFTGSVTGGNNIAQHSGTGTLEYAYGAYNKATNTTTGTITNAYGAYNDAYNVTNGTIAYGYGSYDRAINVGTGTITNAYGTVGEVNQTLGGTMTNAFSLYATGYVGTGGTISNYYGLYLTNPTATGTITNKYALYSANTGNSYFAGNVGIGTASPNSMLQAYGGEVQVGSSSNTCSATTAGAIRYSGGTLYYCNSSAWTSLGGGSLTWPLAGSADSVSAPDYAWSASTNTGLYYNTGIGFAVGGSNIATITSTGLGIGTTTPAATLHVAGSTAIFGTGEASASPGDATIRAPNASGSSVTGGNLNLQAGNGTGAAGSGAINFLTAGGMSAAVGFDAGTSTTMSGTSKTFSFTVGSNSNRVLIVDINVSTFAQSPSSVKYNGVAMTRIVNKQLNSGNNGSHTVYYLVNPSTGAHNIVVTGSLSITAGIGVSSFYNVDQTTPFGSISNNNTTGTSSSLTISSGTGNMVFESIATVSSCASGGTGETATYTCPATPVYASYKTGAASVTMTETFSSQYYDHDAFSINQAGGGTSDTLSTVATITSAGLGIGTTSPSNVLHAYAAGNTTVAKFENGNGYCTMTPITATWSCTSDRRFKKDIVDTGAALPWVQSLRIRDYTLRASGERLTGVIAQEVMVKNPDMVHLGKEGTYTVDAPNPWKLVKAIQELKAENDNLRAANDNLDKRLEALERRSNIAGERKR